MKRILIVNINYKIGGIKKSLDNLIKFLSIENQIDVLFFDKPKTNNYSWTNNNVRVLDKITMLDAYFSSMNDIRSEKKIITYYFLKILFKMNRFFFGSEKTIKRIIDKLPLYKNYDVAIAFSHDNWLNNGFSGGVNYFVLNKVESIKKYAWIHGEIENIGLDKEKALNTYKLFDKVINVSKSCNEQFRNLVNDLIPCDYIYNLFDIDEIKEKSKENIVGFDKNIFTIVTVGRIHQVKRIDKVNIIARKLLDSGFDFRWFIVGDGDLLTKYKKEVLDYDLLKNVIYTGRQDNPYKFISKANLFVLLSDSESYSIVLNEALILDIPILSTDFPAVFETVSPKENGFIVGKSVDEIFETIAYCIKHKEVLEKFKENLRNKPWGDKLKEESENKLKKLIMESNYEKKI